MLSERFQADVPGSMFVYPVRDGVRCRRRSSSTRSSPGSRSSSRRTTSTRTATAGSPGGQRSSCAERSAGSRPSRVPVAFLAVFFLWPLARDPRAEPRRGRGARPAVRRARTTLDARDRVVHALAGDALDRADARRRRSRWRGRSPASRSAAGRSWRRSCSSRSCSRPSSSRQRSSRCCPTGSSGRIWAILLAHVFFNVAVVVRVVGAFWAGLDPRLDDAAATLGASPAQRRLRVTAPLLAPALASAASIVFLFCFTSFGVIVVLGGIRYATLEVEIYNQAARLFDLRTAAALALLQLAAVAATVLVSGRLERAARGADGRASRPFRRDRSDGSAWRSALVVGGSLVLLALPPLALVVRSLPGRRRLRARPLRRASRRDARTPRHAVARGRQLARCSPPARRRSRSASGSPPPSPSRAGAAALDALLMLPLGASAAMLGFGFLLAFDEPPLDLRSSPAIVPLAQSLVAIPFVVRSLVPALRALDGTAHRGRRGARRLAVAGAAAGRAAAPRATARSRCRARVRRGAR